MAGGRIVLFPLNGKGNETGEGVSSNPSDRRLLARERLAAALAIDGPLELLEATLLVALEEYPDLDIRREAARVRIISAEGARRVEGCANPFARLDGLREFFFDELGFRGNSRRFGDPRNSYVNEVLNRRLGIPLTLSILFMDLALAAGFEVRGVGLPGHFVVRLSLDERSLLVDPFSRSRVISEEDCRELVARTTGRPNLFRQEVLEGIDERAMLGRMLLNLKHIYVGQSDYGRALDAVERLLLVDPGDQAEIRDRGFLKAHLGRPGAAIQDLESYLTGRPQAPDAESVRGRLVFLRRQISQLN